MQRRSVHLLLVSLASLVAEPSAFAEDSRSELSRLLSSNVDAGFARAVEPRAFEFPADHGPHPAFRNEWWYVTGNLDATDGRRFGFELTIFRFGLAPGRPASASAWRTNQVYIAHFAVTDVRGERFLAAERFSRGALGLAGAQADPFRVWIDDWEIVATGDPARTWQLVANDEAFGLDVMLSPQKSPVLNGADGLSQKSAEPGNASYYYSITRLQTEGTVRMGDAVFPVSGLSWLDREWSSSALGADQQGWDWFALQFDDGSDLMFYQLRKTDGSQDPQSAGTWTRPDGSSTHVGSEDVQLNVLETWTSPQGGTYPARWRLVVPERRLDIEVVPVLPDQELFTTVRYWEGAVDVTGTRAGAPLRGRGYVELTGYAD